MGWGARAARGAAAAIVTASIVPAVPAQARSCESTQARAASTSLTELTATIACLVNEQRRAAGLRGLVHSRPLAAAAAGHARDMRRREYFGHTSLDGRSFIDRIRHAGYMRGQEGGPWKVGETLAWGAGRRATPAALVDALMASPTHRDVITDGIFRELGIGLVRGTPRRGVRGVTLAIDFGTRTLEPRRPAPPHRPAPSPPESDDDEREEREDGPSDRDGDDDDD